jgi:hypothetical protein
MDDENPRVQDEATDAVITFIESCPKRIAAQYLEQITLKLETFGWIAARDRICAVVGPNQHREK